MTRGPKAAIHLCRAYDIRAGTVPVGARLLVDTVWPRGIAKADLPIDAWRKDVTPRPALRKRFGHDPAKWADFTSCYLDELRAVPKAVDGALDWCRKGPVVLIYAAKDARHTHARVLRDHLAARQEEDETP